MNQVRCSKCGRLYVDGRADCEGCGTLYESKLVIAPGHEHTYTGSGWWGGVTGNDDPEKYHNADGSYSNPPHYDWPAAMKAADEVVQRLLDADTEKPVGFAERVWRWLGR